VVKVLIKVLVKMKATVLDLSVIIKREFYLVNQQFRALRDVITRFAAGANELVILHKRGFVAFGAVYEYRQHFHVQRGLAECWLGFNHSRESVLHQHWLDIREQSHTQKNPPNALYLLRGELGFDGTKDAID
jgi:hypothetical protein